jgi:hypothetical protein
MIFFDTDTMFLLKRQTIGCAGRPVTGSIPVPERIDQSHAARLNSAGQTARGNDHHLFEESSMTEHGYYVATTTSGSLVLPLHMQRMPPRRRGDLHPPYSTSRHSVSALAAAFIIAIAFSSLHTTANAQDTFYTIGNYKEYPSGTFTVTVKNENGLCIRARVIPDTPSECDPECTPDPCACSAEVGMPGLSCGDVNDPKDCSSTDWMFDCCAYVPNNGVITVSVDVCSGKLVRVEAVQCPCP